jgi:hypothetical protein
MISQACRKDLDITLAVLRRPVQSGADRSLQTNSNTPAFLADCQILLYTEI